MNNVRCTATESRLIDCPFDLNHNCDHHEDAGVRCYSSTSGKIWYLYTASILIFVIMIAVGGLGHNNIITIMCRFAS